jgi:glycosyltransferase involved in cell wall biosynthesis
MTNRKFNVAFEAPFLNRSGYGLVSDMLFHAIRTYPKFDMIAIPTPWGGCPPRLTSMKGDDIIKSSVPKSKDIPQPHILISNTIPYMSNPVGSIFNINFCAGIETTECPDMFMEGVNKWGLNIVSSNHAKQGYLNSKIKPTKPIEVIGHGVDTEVYKQTNETNAKVEQALSVVQEDEAFLFVGQVMAQNMFNDRKDMGSLVKAFCEAFKGKDKKPALILKTGGTVYSTFDRNSMIEKLQAIKGMIPDCDVNVYLLHGELNDEEMNALYNHKKVIAGISFTHGEGFCLPLLQQTLAGKPVIASNWSGHLDFLPADKSILLDGTVNTIPKNLASEFFTPTSKWFTVDYEKAKQVMTDFFYNDRTDINKKAAELATINARKYSLKAFETNIHRVLNKYLGVS